MLPPGIDDVSDADPFLVIAASLAGLSEPVPVKVDRILVRGKWSSHLSIATRFRSANGRVFLAGDSAHPLSPMGGHGLNTEICDVWDISWKLAAALSGWGGPQLLESYDTERRPIAHANAAMVNKAAVEVGMPLLTSAQRIGANILVADDETGRKARDDLGLETDKGHWLHDQTGKILGYRYVSPVVIQDEEAGDPPKQEDEITKYIPTTWPGGRPPHVFLVDGKTSIFDHFTKGFSLIDFTPGCEFGKPFSTVSSELGIPLEVVHLPQEQHARDLWERDVVLVRPDGHVAWRSSRSGGPTPTVEAVAAILRQVSGRL